MPPHTPFLFPVCRGIEDSYGTQFDRQTDRGNVDWEIVWLGGRHECETMLRKCMLQVEEEEKPMVGRVEKRWRVNRK